MKDFYCFMKKEEIQLAKSRLSLYLKAEKAILSGQSYEAEGLKLTRANLKEVQTMINQLKKELYSLNSKIQGRAKFRVVRPGW